MAPARSKILGEAHLDTLNARLNQAELFSLRHDRDAALAAFRESLPLGRAHLGEGHPFTARALRGLAIHELAEGDAGAEPRLRDAVERSRHAFPGDPGLARPLLSLGACLVRLGRHAEAEMILRESLAIRESTDPNAWVVPECRSLLGNSLHGQTRYADAEPLIMAGYEGLKAREATLSPAAKATLVEAGERVIRLYEAWVRPEAVASWRAKLHPPAQAR